MAAPAPSDPPLPPLDRLRDEARSALVDFLDAVRSARRERERDERTHALAARTPTPAPTPPALLSSCPLLSQSPGKKTLVLEPHVAAWLGHIAGVALLREHGVEDLLALPLGPGAAPLDLLSGGGGGAAPSSSSASPAAPRPPVLFITRPTPAALAAVAAAVGAAGSAAHLDPAAAVVLPLLEEVCAAGRGE